MKKFLSFAFVFLLTIYLVGCANNYNTEQIKAETTAAWDNANKKECVEQISFKSLNVGGVMKINNLVFDLEKKFDNGKYLVNMETRKNMSVMIDEKAKNIIDMVLDYKKLEGNLKVKHLEQAWSKIGLKANFWATKDEINGYIEFLNVKDMFKDNMSKSVKMDFKLDKTRNKDLVEQIYNCLNCHPICVFSPNIKESLKIGKETPVSFDAENLTNIANAVANSNKDKKLSGDDKTVEHIMFDIFSETKGENIIKNTLKIEEPKAKFKLSTENNQKYVSEITFSSKIKLDISKKQLDIAAQDLTSGENKEKLYNIFKSIIDMLSYDKSFVDGEMEIVTLTTIK